ncbi:MAG: SDR family oxidoreductase [Myxococcales bacterium]|nr:SDR family oxidoreductase [Myxococcales bacterium]
MKHVVVQGASRGVGLGLVRACLARGDRVHATCRTPSLASNLQSLKRTYAEQLLIHQLDVTQETTIEQASYAVRAVSPQIHLHINASGLLHHPTVKPERRLEELSAEALLRLFAVNTIGPLLVIKHFLPCFQHHERSVVASLSARVGSIGDNRRGGWYGYRASKAALNQMHRSLAIELSRRAVHTISVTLHPGTVATDLTIPFRKSVPPDKLFSVEKSVELLLGVMDSLTLSDHGGFFDYARKRIEW